MPPSLAYFHAHVLESTRDILAEHRVPIPGEKFYPKYRHLKRQTWLWRLKPCPLKTSPSISLPYIFPTLFSSSTNQVRPLSWRRHLACADTSTVSVYLFSHSHLQLIFLLFVKSKILGLLCIRL